MWQVLSGLHQEIKMSFMLVGHTKFSPDWCFGLVKQKVKREKNNSLEDLERTVNASSVANVAELVGTQDGTPLVPMYNWTDYLAPHLRRIDHS